MVRTEGNCIFGRVDGGLGIESGRGAGFVAHRIEQLQGQIKQLIRVGESANRAVGRVFAAAIVAGVQAGDRVRVQIAADGPDIYGPGNANRTQRHADRNRENILIGQGVDFDILPGGNVSPIGNHSNRIVVDNTHIHAAGDAAAKNNNPSNHKHIHHIDSRYIDGLTSGSVGQVGVDTRPGADAGDSV